MKIRNLHERRIAAPARNTGDLLNSLASSEDRLWPCETWHPMKFDRPISPGATGGHGPIRYRVKSFEPGRSVHFEFTGPDGFKGCHRFELEEDAAGNSVLRHVLEIEPDLKALLLWLLILRPLHDALIEDSFDKAERNFGFAPEAPGWSRRVKILRWVMRKLKSPGSRTARPS